MAKKKTEKKKTTKTRKTKVRTVYTLWYANVNWDGTGIRDWEVDDDYSSLAKAKTAEKKVKKCDALATYIHKTKIPVIEYEVQN